MGRIGICMGMVAISAIGWAGEEPALFGPDSWGGLPSHTGIVNPVGRAPNDSTVLSLRGEWTFSKRPPETWRNAAHLFTMYGIESPGVPWTGTRTINVPGCWEAQGVGEPGIGRPWKCWWDSAPNPLNHQYEGDCLYMKHVTLPAEWKGKRIWFSVGGVNSQGWFWINDNQVACVHEFCATKKYDVTQFVKPGEDTKIVAVVSNYAASRRGCFNYYNTWGGILRDVEFQATPQVCIDDAWVRGDFDSHQAEVHVDVDANGSNDGTCRIRAEIEGQIAETSVVLPTDRKASAMVKVPLTNFRPWSPEHPNLYWAKIELLDSNGRVTMTRKERFGVRKIEARGKDFYLNGEPFFMRGAGWHSVVPIEGAFPADRERIRRDIAVIRAAGFNQVRLHTECRWPEFFEAADELGLMVMPELPYYSDCMTDDFTFNPMGDVIDMWKTLRRYPSFAIYGGGNEGWFGPALSKRFYEFVRKMDPDRLIFGQDASPNSRTNGPDVSDIVGGPRVIWPSGLYEPNRPFVCHEYLNVCVKLDARLEKKFTGAWSPLMKYDIRKQWLARYGLDLDWGDKLQDAQHILQSYWRRQGLESARADPYCDGYSFWSLIDVACPQTINAGSHMERWPLWTKSVYSGEKRDPFLTYAGQALFDPFFGTKSKGESPAQVAEYNSPSCVLMDDESTNPAEAAAWWKYHKGNPAQMWVCNSTNRVHVTGDRFPITFLFAHYENTKLTNARIDWKFVTNDGAVLLSGGEAIGDQSVGNARKVARAVFTVPELSKACMATLVATVSGNVGDGQFSQSNHWDWWFFPKREPRQVVDVAAIDEFRTTLSARYPGILPIGDAGKAKTVIVTEGSDEERAAIARGQNVIALSKWNGKPNVVLGRWWMGSQLGLVLSDTPILSKLPHQGVLNPLLFRIVKEGRVLPLSDVKGSDYRIVGEGRDACYLYLSETKLANGAKRFLVAGLDIIADTPEGTAILDGILDSLK